MTKVPLFEQYNKQLSDKIKALYDAGYAVFNAAREEGGKLISELFIAKQSLDADPGKLKYSKLTSKYDIRMVTSQKVDIKDDTDLTGFEEVYITTLDDALIAASMSNGYINVRMLEFVITSILGS